MTGLWRRRRGASRRKLTLPKVTSRLDIINAKGWYLCDRCGVIVTRPAAVWDETEWITYFEWDDAYYYDFKCRSCNDNHEIDIFRADLDRL